MATFQFTEPDVFPPGTSVGAYVRVEFMPDIPATAAVETQTVDSNGYVTFTTLSAGTEYVAYAAGIARTIKFRVPTPVSVGSGGGSGVILPFQASHAYKAGEAMTQAGATYTRNADGTSRASFDATEAAAWTALPVAPSTLTQRVSLPLASPNSSSAAPGLDICQRLPVLLPLATTRWRLRVRNAISDGTSPVAAALSFTGVWNGTPVQTGTSTSGVTGAYTAAPTQVLSAFSTPSDGSEIATPWVTDSAQQFAAGVMSMLSMGFTVPSSTNLATSANHLAVYSVGSGAAAGAGSQGNPGGVAPVFQGALLDIVLDYEFVTSALPGVRVPVGLVVGDSVTAGTTNNSQLFSFETYSGMAANRDGFAWVNIAVGGKQASDYNVAPTSRLYARADLTTTVPDFATICLGLNDLNGGQNAATIQSRLSAVIERVVTLGIKRSRIFLCTIPPGGYTGTYETARQTVNSWMTQLPNGIGGVMDFDKATRNVGSIIRATVSTTQFSPTITVDSVAAAEIANGATVYGPQVASTIPIIGVGGTTVSSGGGTTSLTLSANATATASAQSYVFVNPDNANQGDPDMQLTNILHPTRRGHIALASAYRPPRIAA